MATEGMATPEKRTIEVDQNFNSDLKDIVISEQAWSQLATLQTIFGQANFKDKKATIKLTMDDHDDRCVDVYVSPISGIMSKKTGLSKGFLEGKKDFPENTKLSNLVVLSELFNQAICELYDKVMDADSVFLFDSYEQEEPKALFVVKEGKVQLGLD